VFLEIAAAELVGGGTIIDTCCLSSARSLQYQLFTTFKAAVERWLSAKLM